MAATREEQDSSGGGSSSGDGGNSHNNNITVLAMVLQMECTTLSRIHTHANALYTSIERKENRLHFAIAMVTENYVLQCHVAESCAAYLLVYAAAAVVIVC